MSDNIIHFPGPRTTTEEISRYPDPISAPHLTPTTPTTHNTPTAPAILPHPSDFDLTRYGYDHPLGPFLTRYHPDILAEDPGPTAEERGWIISEEEYYRRLRHRSRRLLVTVEREAEIVRMYRRGVPTQDIADKLGISPSTVSASVKRAMKRTLKYAGAEAERNKQLMETDAMVERLLEAILPEPTGYADDGTPIYPPVDPKKIEALLKVQSRRAALTGADQPAKINVTGEVQHNVAVEAVDRVTRYIDIIDKIQETGYGSGLVPPETRELSERTGIDVQPVDLRPLDERVASHSLPRLPSFDDARGGVAADPPTPADAATPASVHPDASVFTDPDADDDDFDDGAA